ncbi:MAG TPA: hypothetical protein VF772_10645, partial [Terriglobales bacterium]
EVRGQHTDARSDIFAGGCCGARDAYRQTCVSESYVGRDNDPNPERGPTGSSQAAPNLPPGYSVS